MPQPNDEHSHDDPRRRVANRLKPPPRGVDVPERPHREWIAIYARLRWRSGGVTWERGTARRWTRDAVCVHLYETPWINRDLWLDPSDITRRDA